MSDITYQQARKLGLKEVKSRNGRGEDPYLPALEALLPGVNSLSEVDLGSIRIDIDQVAGTRNVGRREAFSASFYPLLEENSEFAAKWSRLAASHLKEGIRDPITAVEYLNRFYVVEGHKRVSVLRFFGAATVRAEVKRLLPPKSEDTEIRVYYEFLDFYKVTHISCIRLTHLGSYPLLLDLLCGEDRTVWDEDRQRSFLSGVYRFRKVYKDSPLGSALTQDGALVRYLQIFGPAALLSRTPGELKTDLAAIVPELNSIKNDSSPVLVTDPAEAPRGIISRLVHPGVKELRAAFLHDKDPETSFWTYAHEQGRVAAQASLEGRVETTGVFRMEDRDFDETIRELRDAGYNMVFTTTSRLLPATLTAAAAYQDVKFLNCSVNVSHPILRCYYPRMYEAKFLTGIIAGAMCDSDVVRYISDYPAYSTLASINAFALGVKTVSPRSRVLLHWSSVTDAKGPMERSGVAAVSGQDSLVRDARRRNLGLFLRLDGKLVHAASSSWRWSTFYRKIFESVLDGSWSDLNSTSEQGQSINYWWGLKAGVVDVQLGDCVPPGTAQLVQLLRRQIADGGFRPFDGPLYDQSGTLRIQTGQVLTPLQILEMDWLVDNVDGEIPSLDRLTPPARELVKIQDAMEDTPET